MKQYTPEQNWHHSIDELEVLISELEMKIERIEKLSPFPIFLDNGLIDKFDEWVV